MVWNMFFVGFVWSLFVPTIGVGTMAVQDERAIADSRVPQMLLPAIHSLEVQDALDLDEPERTWLESQFRELDGTWWQARNLPPEKQLQAVADVEAKLMARLKERLNEQQRARLEQLVIQAQGSRALLRQDVATRLALTASQKKQLSDLVSTTVALQNKLDEQRKSGADVSELQKQWQEQLKLEQESSVRLLDQSQRTTWLQVIGTPVDLTKAQRVYPMAPDFAKSSEWLGRSPGSMADLQGKVVVVHFYAFQCINCQRNFNHYNSWNEQWAGQDVVVVGIQTPETPAEQDVVRVRQALEKDGFQFPVIMDSDHANWKAWGNTMWPTVYVVDKRGYIRTWWQGELNWQGATGDQRINEIVQQLLKE